jgi:hypothetical protein
MRPRHVIAGALMLVAMSAGSAPAQACVGDCDGNGLVAVGELVRSARIGLGQLDPTVCPAADANQDGVVTIDESLLGVGNALGGCRCALDFESDNSAPEDPLCVFTGSWNETCGGAGLAASFVGDGSIVAASVFIDPPVFFGAEVVSPTEAELRGWFTREDLSDFQELHGTLRLADGGRTLVIAPETAPFDIGGCDFVLYQGAFAALLAELP